MKRFLPLQRRLSLPHFTFRQFYESSVPNRDSNEGGSTSSSSPSLQSLRGTSMKSSSLGWLTTRYPYLGQATNKHVVSAKSSGSRSVDSTPRYLEREVWLGSSPPPDWKCGVWSSPYHRVRQTRENTSTSRSSRHLQNDIQFGLFAGVSWAELEAKFPQEVAYYKRSAQFGGKFWAKMPLGDSRWRFPVNLRFDVAMRVSQFFSNLHREASKKQLTDLVIVSHGVSIRAFVMMWFHRSPEWFEACANPHNAAMWLIGTYLLHPPDSQANFDRGIIFKGFPLQSPSPVPDWLRDNVPVVDPAATLATPTLPKE